MGDSNFAIRLKLFMDAVGLSSSQLADRCGIPRPSLSAILSGRNKKISDTLIGQIHAVFPQLSVLWLMFGEGDMLLPSSDSSAVDASSSTASDMDSDAQDQGNGGDTVTSGAFPDVPIIGGGMGFGSEFISGPVVGDDLAASSSGAATITPIGPNSNQNSASENSKLPSNGTCSPARENLSGLNSQKNDATDHINKGFEDDLRTVALMRQIENLKANPRKVTQITIYYDDSTFETFFPSR